MKAVVMAGGEGTRLRPLTSNQPKPMVPIVGKPCMEHILDLLRRHEMNEVVVTLAFMPQAIRTYFGDGESLDMDIDYSVEEQPLGTAGSVKLAERAARRHLPRDLGRRALRRRPHGARRGASGEARRGDDRPQVGRQPARVRDRRDRRGGEGRTLPREALVGPGLLGHDQHGHLRARARGASSRPRPTGRTTSPRSCSPCCSRWGARSTGMCSTATGRTSATSSSSARRTSTRSTAASRLDVPGLQLRGNVWVEPGSRHRGASTRRRPRVHRRELPDRSRRRRSARTRCSRTG